MLELSNIGDTGQGWTPGQSGACTGHSTLPDAARNTETQRRLRTQRIGRLSIETATETSGMHQMRIMMMIFKRKKYTID